MAKFTSKQLLEAHGQVHEKLSWLPCFAAPDEIISALRVVADKLQAEVNQLKLQKGRP